MNINNFILQNNAHSVHNSLLVEVFTIYEMNITKKLMFLRPFVIYSYFFISPTKIDVNIGIQLFPCDFLFSLSKSIPMLKHKADIFAVVAGRSLE